MPQNPFDAGGVWLWLSGAPGLADPLSLSELRAAHPLWAADVATLAPWRQVVLGPETGPAAGTWLVAEGGGGRVSPAVCCVGSGDSSLDVARIFAEAGLLMPFASVLAVTQRSGRGQMRRQWLSPPGNIYAALLWPRGAGALGTMAPVVTGACVVEALGEQGLAARLKWPNDVLLDQRKVAGILLEERDDHLLAGIGLNLASAPDAALLRRDHAAPAGALSDFVTLPGVVTLWTELVKSVQTCYRLCVALSGSRELSRFLEHRLAWLGQEVLVRESASDGFRARIVGLVEDGGLRLRQIDSGPGQDLTLHSGSISLL